MASKGGKGGASIDPGSISKSPNLDLINQDDVDSILPEYQSPVETKDEQVPGASPFVLDESEVTTEGIDEGVLPEYATQEDADKILEEDMVAEINEDRDAELTAAAAENNLPEDVSFIADAATKQRERERVLSLKEKYKAIRDADWHNPNLQMEWQQNMDGVFARGRRTNAVLGTLGATLSPSVMNKFNLSEGSWNTALTETKKVAGVPEPKEAAHPAFKQSVNKYISATISNIIHHPELLNAGVTTKRTNSHTGEEYETRTIDPTLGIIMSMVVEQHILKEMFAAKDSDKQESISFADDETIPGQIAKTYSLARSSGRNELGRDVFREWHRTKNYNAGRPTDEYMGLMDSISPAVFDILGDVAKNIYALANRGIFQRHPGVKEQDHFLVTEKGSEVFTRLNTHLSQLFGTNEVKPLSAPTETGQPIYEGRQFVRNITTMVDDLGDISRLDNAMKNLNRVAFINDPTKEKLTFLFGHQALLSHQEPARTADGNINTKAMFAETFKIGTKKYQELLNQKQRYKDMEVLNLKFAREAEKPSERDWFERQAEMYAEAYENYNPTQILAQEREKFMNIMGAAAEYSGEKNFLTYYIQALTGRLGVQQTLYNPQSSKIIRNLVGSGHIYRWNIGDGSRTENFWKAAMSAALFEKAFKKERGYKRVASNENPYAERVRVFDEHVRTNSDFYSRYVAWGEELERILEQHDAISKPLSTGKPEGWSIFKEKFLELKNSKSQDESNQVRQSLEALPTIKFSEDLKQTLQKQGDEAVVYANYLMELAKFNRAKNNKAQMTSTLIPEADGQTHGPGTMGVIYGSIPIAKRIGVVIPDSSSFAEVYPEHMDLRDNMAEWMQENLVNGVGTIIPVGKEGIYRNLLEAAIMDRENFLKKSPMTMGYGQDMGSLKEYIWDTIYADTAYADGDMEKGMRQQITENNLELNQVADWLHTLLVESIYATFGKEALEINKLLKAHAYLSIIKNKLIKFKSPSGHTVTIAGKVSEENPGVLAEEKRDKKGKVIRKAIIKPEQAFTLNPGRLEEIPFTYNPNLSPEQNQINKEKIDQDNKELAETYGKIPTTEGKGYWQAKTKMYSSKAQAWAPRMRGDQEVFGGYTIGRSQTSGVQGFDGNMVSRTAYDSSKIIEDSIPKYIPKEAAGFDEQGKTIYRRIPWMGPIFDAFLMDLGSGEMILKEANRHHLNSLTDNNYVEQIFEDWYKDFLNDMSKIRDDATIDLKDLEHTGLVQIMFSDEGANLQKVFNKLMVYNKPAGEPMAAYQKRVRKEAWNKVKAFRSSLIKEGIVFDPTKQGYGTLTGSQYKSVMRQFIRYLGFQERNPAAISQIKNARKQLKEMTKGKSSHNIDFAHFFSP